MQLKNIQSYAEIQAMDVLLSKKKIKIQGFKTLLQAIGNYGIKQYSRNLYKHYIGQVPDDYFSFNHVRLFVGEIEGVPTGFEFTAPAAGFFEWRPWMMEPEYGLLYRYDGIREETKKIYSACLPFSKKLYDFGQLIDIALGWETFSFGKDYEVCSTGTRKILEELMFSPLFPEVDEWRTPPCSWAFSPMWKVVEN